MKLSEGGLLTALAKMLSDYQGQEFKVHIYCMPPVEKLPLTQDRNILTFSDKTRQIWKCFCLPAAASKVRNSI